MIATIGERMANTPLPLIPRRSSSRLVSLPDHSDSTSSTSSPSDASRPTIRTKRVRDIRPSDIHTHPDPPQNTHIFAHNDATRPAISRPMIYTPGMPLRLALDNRKPRRISGSHDSHTTQPSAQGAKSALCEFPKDGRLVHKKSGQLVKSSLKSSKSATRNVLSIITVPQSSKSEPTTPTSKAVHFDAQLEHVKLFLAEQKPLAVSRDGSPTDDTSGTDSDFPKFIYGEDDDWPSRKRLLMQLPNMPSAINPNSDVALEDLSLTPDATSILGRVRVRNLSFAKWVAIRFTFDAWQTTSEVTGRYVESISSEFDRFSFTIRLNDLLARIELKTLVMAIRYSVAGQDIWDNNNGQNYLATFTKSQVEETRLSDEEAAADLADLRSKLEKVSQSDDRTGPAFLAQHSRRQDPDAACFRTSASLASRYDFATPLKSPWEPSQSPPSHNRNQSFPLTGSRTSPSLIPWPQKGGSIDVYSPKRSPLSAPSKLSIGSPRDISDDAFTPVRRQQVEVEDGNNIPPYTPRNHRRGYFDSVHAPQPSVRRTSPETPTAIQKMSSNDAVFPPPLRFSSFSPVDDSLRSRTSFNGDNIGNVGGESESSTPPLFTPSSSRSSTPSPTKMFTNPPYVCDENTENLSPDTHYRQFIDKFCFFTGKRSALDESTVNLLPRAHSASDIEEFLAGTSPRLPCAPTLALTPNEYTGSAGSLSTLSSISPTRSSSLDDLMLNRSGSLTPTVSRLALMSASA